MPWAVAGAAIGAAGAIGGAAINSSAAGAASKAQQAASRDALVTQNAQWGYSQQQLLPFIQEGIIGRDNMLSRMDSLTAPYSGTFDNAPNFQGTADFNGTVPQFQGSPAFQGTAAFTDAAPSFNWSPTQAQLESTPGYQFNLSQGLKAAQNAAAAKGLGVSGAALKGATSYASGLADTTYQNQFQNALSGYGANLQSYDANLNAYNSRFANNINLYNSQFQNNLSGFGADLQSYNTGLNTYNTKFANNLNLYNSQFQNALNQFTTNRDTYYKGTQNAFNDLYNMTVLGANAASGAATNTQQAAQNTSNLITGAGNAQASGIIGQGNAASGGIGSAANSIGNALIGLKYPSNTTAPSSPGSSGGGLGGFFNSLFGSTTPVATSGYNVPVTGGIDYNLGGVY